MPATTVAVLGSTGSIGTQTLDVVAARPDDFDVVAQVDVDLPTGPGLLAGIFEAEGRRVAASPIFDKRVLRLAGVLLLVASQSQEPNQECEKQDLEQSDVPRSVSRTG